jgi:MFS family permease
MGRLSPNKFNLAIIIFAALGSTASSYGMSVMAGILGQPSFYASFRLASVGEPGYSHTATLISAFNGVNSAASALGALFSAWAADAIGRRWNLVGGAAILVVGAALCAGSVNVAMFLVARFIAGWGIGMLITGVPL